MDIMSLPLVMVENIFSYLSFDEIAKCRLVSKSFNEICSKMLNRGFCRIERRHSMALKNVKAQLPRRESERRYHQLSRHCDILTSIETRISMLNMTYSKFMDHNMCCFIPGKVIDEIRRVLILVETESNPPRAHEVLQELRDISSMAIEHFDDKISPAFRKKLQEGAAQPARPANSVLAPFVVRQEMATIRRRSLLNAKMSFVIANQYKKLHRGMIEHKRIVSRQDMIIKQMMKRQKEQDATIADLKKRIDECDIKCTEMTHTNVGGKTLTILPNMKPRKPTFKLPSLSEDEGEPPRKILKTEPKNKTATTNKGISQEINQLEGNLKRTLNTDQNKERKKQKIE